MRLAGYVAQVEEMKNIYRILLEKPDGKKDIQRFRHRSKYMDVKVKVDVNYIKLVQYMKQ
jgi:hypothetical protein